MARDIRDLFKDEAVKHEHMPKNHEERFLEKLDATFPVVKRSRFNRFQMAASIVILLSLTFGGYRYFKSAPSSATSTSVAANNSAVIKTLGDVSPGLKKVEDYYLASINLELSKMEYTQDNKDLIDGYLEQIGTLNKEYERLSLELTESGPNELTVNALIDNLKLRLNLLYRLREQLETVNNPIDETSVGI